MRITLKQLVFIFIIFIASVTRLYQIDSVPIVLNHDEAAIGYNGWSIAKTGKDEYGNPFPLLFRSFEDFKLPGYPYATAVTTSLFGLSEFAVRLPSALFGIGTVIVVFFLVQQFFPPKGKKGQTELSLIPTLSMLMLAIMPWHINFSRAAFETNGSVFFITLGTYCLLKARSVSRFYIFAGLSFVGALLFYYTARVLIPILCITYVVFYAKNVWQQRKMVILALVIATVALLPILPSFFTSGTARVNQVSIFNEPTILDPYIQMRMDLGNGLLARILFNNRVAYFMTFVDNYTKNLNLNFIFANGTGPYGLLYAWQFPFLFIGLATLFISRTKTNMLMLVWLLATPIVGGLTMNQPNQLRTLPNVIPLSYLTAVGLTTVSSYLVTKTRQRIFRSVMLGIGILFFIQFASVYMLYQPKRDAEHWGDGKKQLAVYLQTVQSLYDRIYVTGDKWRPYIHYLFYTGYDPATFQQQGNMKQIDNIRFGTADWDREDYWRLNRDDLSPLIDGKTLFILSAGDFAKQQQLRTNKKVPYDFTVIEEIQGKYLRPAFYAVVLK